jgi:hypothetical protein
MVKLQDAVDLFSLLLKEKEFLEGSSSATIRIYSKAWSEFKKREGAPIALHVSLAI